MPETPKDVDFAVEVRMNALEVKPNDFIDFHYTNYVGEARRRQCHVIRIIYGSTPHHEEPQWFLIGEDPEKGFRTFALKDMKDVKTLYKARN